MRLPGEPALWRHPLRMLGHSHALSGLAAGELEGGRGEAARALYGRIAAGSGVVSLLLVSVTVLMVWKP